MMLTICKTLPAWSPSWLWFASGLARGGAADLFVCRERSWSRAWVQFLLFFCGYLHFTKSGKVGSIKIHSSARGGAADVAVSSLASRTYYGFYFYRNRLGHELTGLDWAWLNVFFLLLILTLGFNCTLAGKGFAHTTDRHFAWCSSGDTVADILTQYEWDGRSRKLSRTTYISLQWGKGTKRTIIGSICNGWSMMINGARLGGTSAVDEENICFKFI